MVPRFNNFEHISALDRSKVFLQCMAVLLTAFQIVPSHADDLLSVYRKALSQDTAFEAAKHALEAAQQKIPQARAGFLPTINWTASTSLQKGSTRLIPVTEKSANSAENLENTETSAGASTEAPAEVEPLNRSVRSHGWNLQLSQPVFRPITWANFEQADAQVKQAQAQYMQAQQDLILRVAQGYFDVVVAANNVRVAIAQDNSVELQLKLAKRNFEVGTSTVTDVHEAKSRFELSKAQRIAAENEFQAKQAELERITGSMPIKLAQLKNQATPPMPAPLDLTTWINKAKEQHPLVLAQSHAQEVANKEVSKNQAAHLPTLDFTAARSSNYSSGNLSSPTDMETRAKSNQYSLQLTVPIYAGGMVDSRIKESVSILNKAQAELESARRQAASTARQAYYGVMNGHAQIEALSAAVTASKSSVDANKIGYKIGTRINIDVLNAEQQLFAAIRDLSKARVETFLQGLRLKASIGAISEKDLMELNDSLVYSEPDIRLSAAKP